MAQPDPGSIAPDEMDDSFVPRPTDTVEEVAVGPDVVLLDGWRSATAVNHIGAVIWSCFDGVASLDEISRDLSRATGADPDLVRSDVLAFTRQIGADGFLTGVDRRAGHGVPEISLVAIPDLEVGEEVADSAFDDLDGVARTLADLRGREALLVNWSPHCGYCWVIAERLAVLVEPLDQVGVQLVLITWAGPEANREVVEAAGLDCPVFVRHGDVDPFIGHGTPCAYHVDAAGRLLAPIVHGAEQVLAVASELAGVDPVTLLTDPDSDPVPAGTRYLLGDDEVCAPGVGPEPAANWSGTNAYRLADFHVGIRYDSDATAAVLDDLFGGRRVRDRRAGYSYAIALNHPRAAGSGSRPGIERLNLLVTGGRPVVRSRHPSRVMRALLWRLTDDVVGYETEVGRIRVQAAAVLVDGKAVLLPSGVHVFGDAVQPLFARAGIRLADLPFPEIDLGSAELVVPEPAIDHDPAVLIGLDRRLDSSSELAPVVPGRYPLMGWGVIHPGHDPVVDLSPAQAAAATLSSMYEADDAPARLRELGALFTRIRGFGLWYHSDAEFVDAVRLAVQGRGGSAEGIPS